MKCMQRDLNNTSMARGKRMDNETSSELLQQLLAACNEGRAGALQLAQMTDIEALRAFLYESAQQYRRAADEIRKVCVHDTEGMALAIPRDKWSCEPTLTEDDVVASWERTECEALTYFRDAYDLPLPPALTEAVRRHLEAGVNRLERLRKLRLTPA